MTRTQYLKMINAHFKTVPIKEFIAFFDFETICDYNLTHGGNVPVFMTQEWAAANEQLFGYLALYKTK